MLVQETIAAPAPVENERPACFHCGAPCPDASLALGDRLFCCAGCRTVCEILEAGGLQRFYDLEQTPGVRPTRDARQERFAYLNDEHIRSRLLDFSNGKTARVTFHIPAIHCIACVWLLENLFRLKPGIGRTEVNFPRKELSLAFDEQSTSLAEVVTLLSSLGYEPALNLQGLESVPVDPASNRLILKIGIAGFSFGNIMLLSFPSYFGLNPATEAVLQHFFGYISLLLAAPVLLYSASPYWRAAWTCARQRIITIELPIAIGIAALFAQSLFDIAAHRGEGYLDSFSGLIFLLLCGRWFQQRTFAALSFDRDYKSYFPLSVVRKTSIGESASPLTSLEVGDVIVVRSGELVPADSVLRSGNALIDYSFVTGEADPVVREPGDYVYAGGRQVGGAIEMETVKRVSQSYLTSLWNNEAFHKPRNTDINNITNTAGRYFTYAVMFIALAVAAYWSFADPAVAVRAFSAVLIVACPCALSLAAPFTLGSAMRILGRHHLYLRNTSVVESLSKQTAIVFDKTGTLTSASDCDFDYQGAPLTDAEWNAVAALSRHSTHPYCRALGENLQGDGIVEHFFEMPGRGVQGIVGGTCLQMGSKAWLGPEGDEASAVYIAIDGSLRGRFVIKHAYRPTLSSLVTRLAARFKLSVISGDNANERATLDRLYSSKAELLFQQSPHDKLEFVRQLQKSGERVMMLGDGLNDAGALKQSDVGVAVTEDIAAFTPACDAILDAHHIGKLDDFLSFSRSAMVVLKAAFILSLLYNVVGLAFAASGNLSPMISAILMPVSSFSVIGLSLLGTRWAARRKGLR